MVPRDSIATTSSKAFVRGERRKRFSFTGAGVSIVVSEEIVSVVVVSVLILINPFVLLRLRLFPERVIHKD